MTRRILAPTLFGRPVVQCDDPKPHPWHGDGNTYCGGVQ